MGAMAILGSRIVGGLESGLEFGHSFSGLLGSEGGHGQSLDIGVSGVEGFGNFCLQFRQHEALGHHEGGLIDFGVGRLQALQGHVAAFQAFGHLAVTELFGHQSIGGGGAPNVQIGRVGAELFQLLLGFGIARESEQGGGVAGAQGVFA